MGSIARQQILDMVRQVVLAEIGDEPVKVYLFGSWARGEEHISSDIDIAVDSVGGVHVENLTRLREALEESTVPYRVDVVDLAEAAKVLVAKVRKEGIVWKG
ncbi:MAG: nucleotidyltransferase protein [Firmicutes bacterium]|nr:nucleotidyltransferase protein [Bacillota bacterium]